MRFSLHCIDVMPHGGFNPNSMFSLIYDERCHQGHGDHGVAFRGHRAPHEFEVGAGALFDGIAEHGEEGTEDRGGKKDKGDEEEDDESDEGEEDEEDGIEADDDVDAARKKKKKNAPRSREGPIGSILKISAFATPGRW
jgi:hypothetical protein